MFARRVHSLSLLLSLGTALAVACGGPNEGYVNIVDADGGSSGSGASGGSSGNGNAGESSQGGDGDGAGGDGEVPVLPTPPEVVSVTPSEDDLAEPTDSIEIEFSEGLDPDTITPESIQISDGANPIAGTLDYSGVTVTFTPDDRLDLLGSYVVTVTTDVTDGGGTAMEEPYEATFQVRDGAWSEEMVVENPLDTGYLYPQLISPVIDGRGNALVVWVQAKSTQSGLDEANVWGRFFHPGEGWTDPFEIDQSDGACSGASVAMGPDGDAVVAWEQYEDGAPQVVARRYIGGDWEADAQRLDSAMDTPTGGYTVTTGFSPTGEAHVFWNFNDGTYVNLKGAHISGDQPWSEPAPIGLNYYLSAPAVAFDPDGNGFAFFVTRSNGTSDEGYLYGVRYIASSEAWNNGQTIPDSNDATFNGVSAVADDEGGAHALFVRFNTTTSEYDVAETHFSKAEGFSSAVGIDSLDSGPASVPRVSTNGSERVASWSQFASSTENAYSALSDGEGYLGQELRSDGDYSVEYGDVVSGLDRRGNGVLLFAQIGGNDNQDIGILFSRLAGGEWTDAERINQKVAQYQDARVAVAPNGIAVAAWSIGTRQTANSILVSVFE